MNALVTKNKETMSNNLKNAAVYCGAAASIAMSQLAAFADNAFGGPEYHVNTNASFDNIESNVLAFIFLIFRIVGAAIACWGIFGFITARTNGEAASIGDSIGKLVGGIALAAAPSVLRSFGVIG